MGASGVTGPRVMPEKGSQLALPPPPGRSVLLLQQPKVRSLELLLFSLFIIVA